MVRATQSSGWVEWDTNQSSFTSEIKISIGQSTEFRSPPINPQFCTEDIAFWRMINMYRQQFIYKHCHAAKNHNSQRCWWMCCVIKRATTTKAWASLAKIGITARSLFPKPQWQLSPAFAWFRDKFNFKIRKLMSKKDTLSTVWWHLQETVVYILFLLYFAVIMILTGGAITPCNYYMSAGQSKFKKKPRVKSLLQRTTIITFTWT